MKIFQVTLSNESINGPEYDKADLFLHASFSGAIARLKAQNFVCQDGEESEENLSILHNTYNSKMSFLCDLGDDYKTTQGFFPVLARYQHAYIQEIEIND